jgi:pyrroloquinoline quinone biosynthesis protein B
VSADGERWFVLHASPDIRQQIEAFPALHPRASRHTPIAGVLLANGDLDACLGLYALRESQPLVVYATNMVARGFRENNAIYRTLERTPDQLSWRALALGVEQPLEGSLWVTAIAVPGKVPLHLTGRCAPSAEDNVALRIRDARHSVVWAPSVAAASPGLVQAMREASCILFDGTFWSSDELEESGAGTRRAEEMGHWPLSAGSLELLAAAPASRRVLVHINNTNPVLIESSPERAEVSAAGVEVAFDGMEIVL